MRHVDRSAVLRTCLTVEGLQTHGYHGLRDEERLLGQKFVFDIRARLVSTRSHSDDALGSSIRYDELISQVVKIAHDSKFRTLEALGETIALALLQHFERMQSVVVGVSKLSPPIPQFVDKVAVEVRVDRKDVRTQEERLDRAL
jgi:7,8-dihydroneopterin aldolase/epimerase/oxygenase